MDLRIFLFGFLGAGAAEFLRYTRKQFLPSHVKYPGYYVILQLALFCFFGGVIALIIPATTDYGAFYVGASWPTLFSAALAKQIQDPPPPPTDNQGNKRAFASGDSEAKKRNLKFNEFLGILFLSKKR